jgi:UDP-N-acetyl-D-glucosamine dehydrogenase
MSGQNRPTLAIIGQGYVGLPLAMAAVDAGWSVIGVDTFADKVERINNGSSPVEDISDAQLQDALTKGAYRATSDFSSVSQASVVTICVPTPLNEMREPDLTMLRDATSGIAPFVSNQTLIVSESTSYPGTLRQEIIPLVNALKLATSPKLFFASAPERVNPGDPVWNQNNTPRLVGAIDQESQERAMEFYRSLCDVAIPVSTPEVAEAAKLLENTFRLVNIALINEFSKICEVAAINVNEVIDAASTKPYGFMPFRPGVGVGGHCIPVDPLYLTWWARQNGSKAEFVEFADSINHSMPRYVAQRALSLVASTIQSPRVLILGVAYKPGVGDVRETPVSELRNELLSMGAVVAWHDPLVSIWQGSQSVELGWQCDVAILATKQPGMNLDLLLASGFPILDCTNSLNGQTGVTSL